MSQLPGEIEKLPEELLEPDYLLPSSYNETYIHLMIRDPDCIFAYWEVSSETKAKFIKKFGFDHWECSPLSLRLFWQQKKEIITLSENTNNWYVHLGGNPIPQYGELGKLLPNNNFYTLAVSNYLFPFSQKNINFNKPENNLLDKTFKEFKPGISS